MAGSPVVQWTVEYLLGLGLKRFIIAVAPRIVSGGGFG